MVIETLQKAHECESAQSLSLPPIIHPWEHELLQQPQGKGSTKERPTELERFSALAGGPFHVLNPAQFRSNLRGFAEVCKAVGVKATIYFARKANKSECWIPVVAEEAHGVDVASGPEFIGAISGGVPAHNLVVTGAEKPESLLELALRHGSLLVVDSPSELFRVSTLAAKVETGSQAQLLLRLLPDTQTDSRFGTSASEWMWALASLSEKQRTCINCAGASFHLNGYSAEERGHQAHLALDFLEVLKTDGWRVHTLDIGGGFSIQYCDNTAWEEFSRVALGDSPKVRAFHGGHLPRTTYPYGGQRNNGPAMLSEVLMTLHPDSEQATYGTLAERLRVGNIRLGLEPGRALLNGCGMSVFPVQGVKERKNYCIITAAGLSMSLSEQWKGSEFLPDVTLWRAERGVEQTEVQTAEGKTRQTTKEQADARRNATKEREDEPTAACVGGSSCMEYDMLTWRIVPLQRRPQRGDLLIYHNTAGYQMDKNESEFHQLRLPMRFVYDGEGTLPRIDRPLHEEMP